MRPITGTMTSSRITEDRDKWRKYVHGVANPWIEDGLRTEQNRRHLKKPEVQDVLQRRQMRSEPQPWVICTENLAKFGCVILEIYSDRAITILRSEYWKFVFSVLTFSELCTNIHFTLKSRQA